MLGEGGRLGFDAPSIIDRCVRSLYERANYRNHIREIQMYDASCTSDPMACPRLSELQAELRLQPEETAKALATVLEMYSGGESTFSQRTNVDLSSRFIVLDISGLGGNSMLTLTLLVCLEFIKGKMIENGKKGIYTHAYFDEFWCLLRSELASSYLSEMWKMCRVWKGVPTGIMQNTADLFGCPYASGILENTHFIMLHSLEQSDREAMRSLLRLSDEQVRRITNVAPGRGLIHTRGTTIPFENEYPEDSLSYKTFADSLQKRSLMPARRRLFTV
jgi:type IV secretory pathway VirB4 component